MPNMSYCRFSNTLGDLQDCYDHINDGLRGEENRARKNLIELCQQIAADYSDQTREELDAEFPDKEPED